MDRQSAELGTKVAQVTFAFWVMKICATTLGETAGDLFSMTLGIGYGASTVWLMGVFLIVLLMQLASTCFHPPLYWGVILATSTAGTTLSDFMDRTLGLGYAQGALILFVTLLTVLAFWHLADGTISVSGIRTRKSETFYWAAILVSNTLGTALGDFLADDSGLGFLCSAAVIGCAIALIALASHFTRLNRVALFWLAFVLTRPFGATFGDLLTKSHDKGGLDFGTIGSSAILAFVLVVLVAWTTLRNHNRRAEAASKPQPGDGTVATH